MPKPVAPKAVIQLSQFLTMLVHKNPKAAWMLIDQHAGPLVNLTPKMRAKLYDALYKEMTEGATNLAAPILDGHIAAAVDGSPSKVVDSVVEPSPVTVAGRTGFTFAQYDDTRYDLKPCCLKMGPVDVGEQLFCSHAHRHVGKCSWELADG